ncbi:MAG: glucuronosyltransferase [Fimbriimonadaceae bacterium]
MTAKSAESVHRSLPTKAVLFTGHYAKSKRKAGFHFIGEALAEMGVETLLFTYSYSPLSNLRQDFRAKLIPEGEHNKLVQVGPNLWSYVWRTPFHPVRIGKGLDAIARRVFSRYGELPLGEAEPFIRECSLAVFESGAGIMLLPRVQELAPDSFTVYRVSDDLKGLGSSPTIIRAEQELAGKFDLISSPCDYIHVQFEHLPSARIHFHGIEKDQFDQEHSNPYKANSKNIVFVGNSFCDTEFINWMAEDFPECNFHVIGPIDSVQRRDNLKSYGEMPFRQTIPFLKFADVGLQTRSWFDGAPSLSDSLKMHQYTYCKLSIVLPEFIQTDRPHCFAYVPSDRESMKAALQGALEFDRSSIDTSKVLSWRELTSELLPTDLSTI